MEYFIKYLYPIFFLYTVCTPQKTQDPKGKFSQRMSINMILPRHLFFKYDCSRVTGEQHR